MNRPKTRKGFNPERILREQADVVLRYNKQLAMDFDTPAKGIISLACAELGITPAEWDEVQRLRSQD